MNGAVDKLKLFLRRPSGVLGIAILVAVTAMALTAGVGGLFGAAV